MRSLLLLVALAACGARSSHAVAWPKTAAAETDGGESLAPRAAAATVVAVSEDDDADAATPAETVMPTVTVPAATPVTPAATPATAPSDDTITVDEIVIEIDD